MFCVLSFFVDTISVLDPLVKLSMVVDKRMKLTCLVQGDPIPEIQWLLNGKELQKKVSSRYMYRKRTMRLVIRKFNKNDGGNYTCVASNRKGRVQMTYIVTPKIKNKRPTTMPSTPGVDEKKVEKMFVKEGENVTLSCASPHAKTRLLTWVLPIRPDTTNTLPGIDQRGKDGGSRVPSRHRSGSIAHDIEARDKVKVQQFRSVVNGTLLLKVSLFEVTEEKNGGLYKCMALLYSDSVVTIKFIELIVIRGELLIKNFDYTLLLLLLFGTVHVTVFIKLL